MRTKKAADRPKKDSGSSRSTIIAVISLAVSLFGFCLSVYTAWHGNSIQHLLEAAYFDHQIDDVTSPAAGTNPAVVLQFKNTGRSRATVETARASVLVARNEKDAFDRMLELEPRKLPTTGEINPEGRLSAPVRLGHDIRADELARLQRGDLNVYVVGRLDYRDSFGASHIRYVCDWYDFENQAWVGCPGGNSTTSPE